MIELPAAFSALASSGDHRRGDDKAPKPYKDGVDVEFRGKVLEILARLEWAFIGTMSEDDWPFTSASRFVHIEAEDRRPAIYFLAPRESLMTSHIVANPRIGIEAHLAVGWLERRKARAVQLQSLASIVNDPGEADRVRAAFADKYASDRAFSPVSDELIVRADSLSVVNFYATARPQWGYIDFTADS